VPPWITEHDLVSRLDAPVLELGASSTSSSMKPSEGLAESGLRLASDGNDGQGMGFLPVRLGQHSSCGRVLIGKAFGLLTLYVSSYCRLRSFGYRGHSSSTGFRSVQGYSAPCAGGTGDKLQQLSFEGPKSMVERIHCAHSPYLLATLV
jgi:hypothetical protein